MRLNLGLAAILLLGVPALSHANEYVCAVTYEPPMGAYAFGASGGVGVTLYDEPDCSGNFTKIRWFCSKTHSSVSCASGVYFSEQALIGIRDTLVDAAAAAMPISGQIAPCNGGGDSCWSNVSIFAQ